MPQKKTLKQLIELARSRCENAASQLSASRSREQADCSKLQLLENYRREYTERFDQARHAGLQRGVWDYHHQFILQLDSAIRNQRERVEMSRGSVEQCRADWRAANDKVKSFDTLDQRRQMAERAIEQRRERREQDEFASRKRAD